ncbi:lactose-binding lectin l-2-like [Scomber japonicus]|uniref:lactose-binding lectin l-2-like n=1 Tax=Scomber japonicus TaxID=13676 RepID=UPI002304F171|nr:lactose-binding lectin l-2-like [Scomber japonicus]
MTLLLYRYEEAAVTMTTRDSNMLFLFLFLFLFGLALGAESPSSDRPLELQQSTCPPLWYKFKGRCYKYVSTHKTWADAELYCVSQNANLVSVHSQQEQDFVKFLIKNFDHAEGFTWMGLSDAHKEGGWMWSDGCPVGFVFWHAGQPDNYNGHENCAEFNWGQRLKWNEVPCFFTRPSVCATRTVCP